jgi:hypothetical protein
MMETILIIVSLRFYKDMRKESAKVLTELNYVKNFHHQGALFQNRDCVHHRKRISVTTKPSREK